MMSNKNLEKRRAMFLKGIRDIATKIKNNVLNNEYEVKVYFSGRDEDFVIIEFISDDKCIEWCIELRNHTYNIEGKEKIFYKLFEIKNGGFHESIKGEINFSDCITSEKLIDSIANNLINDLLNKE